ncbi:uncharacterized protein LOC144094334 isoform X2 [Amblyomma americanum]
MQENFGGNLGCTFILGSSAFTSDPFNAAIRVTINTKGKRACDVQKEWPLLFTQRHFLAHFRRLMDTQLEGLFVNQEIADLEVLYAFLRHSLKGDEALQWLLMTDRAAQDMGRPKALLSGVFPLLCIFFKTSTCVSELISDLPPTAVVVVLGTSIFDCDCTCIVTLDGAKCFEGLSFLAAMETLCAAYFCLNMKYNQELQATLEFIQRQLVGMNPEEGSRQLNRSITSVHPKVHSALQQLDKLKKKCAALQISVQSRNTSPPGERSPSPQMERTKEESASLQLGDKFFPSPLEEPGGYRALGFS